MIKFKTASAIAVAVGSLFAGAAFAQSNYSIEQRDRIEDARINQGIRSGELTRSEAFRLEGERAQIERMERRARADGVMTQAERSRIDHAQDRLSRDIYRESHDNQTANRGWRGNERPYGWDRRNDRFDNRFGRNDNRFDHRDNRVAHNDNRFGGHVNGDTHVGQTTHTPGTWTHSGSHTGTGSTGTTTTGSASTGSTSTGTASTGTASTGTASTGTASTAGSRWNRSSQASATARAPQTSRPVTVARAGGVSGHRTR